MKFTNITALVIFFFCNFASKAHHSHLSVINVDIKDSVISISMQINKEDLIYVTNKPEVDKILNQNSKIKENITSIVFKYLKQNFEIQYNASYSTYNLKSVEEQNEYIIFIYESFEIKPINEITIKNTLFIEQFNEQKNLVIINNKGKEKGLEFNIDKYEETISY